MVWPWDWPPSMLDFSCRSEVIEGVRGVGHGENRLLPQGDHYIAISGSSMGAGTASLDTSQ